MWYDDPMLWGYFSGQPLSIVSRRSQSAYPKWLYVDQPHPYIVSNRHVEWYGSFIDACEQRKATKICFVRTYALGDILMLLPIIRAMRRELGCDPIKLVCRENFWESLRSWDSQNDFEFWRWDGGRTYDYGCDIHINLDSCLECDHWGGDESHQHRLVLYGNALGLEVKRES